MNSFVTVIILYLCYNRWKQSSIYNISLLLNQQYSKAIIHRYRIIGASCIKIYLIYARMQRNITNADIEHYKIIAYQIYYTKVFTTCIDRLCLAQSN